VDFSEALRELKAGKCVARKYWLEAYRHSGAYLKLVVLPDPGFMPQLLVRYRDEKVWRPFAGANWDLLSEDWQIVEP